MQSSAAAPGRAQSPWTEPVERPDSSSRQRSSGEAGLPEDAREQRFERSLEQQRQAARGASREAQRDTERPTEQRPESKAFEAVQAQALTVAVAPVNPMPAKPAVQPQIEVALSALPGAEVPRAAQEL